MTAGHQRRASDRMAAGELVAFAERILQAADQAAAEGPRSLLLWEELLRRAAHYLDLAEQRRAAAAGWVARERGTPSVPV